MSKKTKQPQKEKRGSARRAERIAAKQRNLRHLHPALQTVSDWMTPVGLLLRLVPAYLLLAGLYLFTDNAFGFATPKLLFLPMIAVVLLLHGAACWNKIVSVIAWILTAAGGIALLVLSQNPLAFLVNLGRGLYNSAISYMMTIGYGVLYVFKLDTPLDAETELMYARIAFGVLQVICAIIVAHCTAKKIRVWPIAVITAFSYTLVFLYNISTSKWGIALSVAGICGLLCMKMADKYAALPKHKTVSAAELEKEADDTQTEAAEPTAEAVPADAVPDIGDVSAYTADKKAERAFSLRGAAVVGFSAVLCTLLALLAAAIPASRVKEPWKTYETIDTVMETIRAYEMAIITGEDMQIADLGLTGAAEILDARSSIALPRYFTGKPVLEIQSNLNLPIYLRSWVSATFLEDKWYVADEKIRDEFKEMFPEGFSAEDITYRFLRNVNSKLVNYKTKTSYVNHEDDGFMTTLVSLKNLGVAGNILFLPSKMNTELSLQEYGSIEEAYQKRWINYFDGIAYSRAFHKGAKYSAVAYLPLYKEQDWWQELNRKRMMYGTFLDVYTYVGNDVRRLLEDEDTTVFDTGYNAYSMKNLREYYLSLDSAGQQTFMDEIHEVLRYNDYVTDSGVYTSLTQDEALNQKLRDLALEIIYSEPLPETGLEVAKFDGEEYDMTDILAADALRLTVGDVAIALYATEEGKIYVDYGNGVNIGEDERIEYMWTPESEDSDDAIVIEDEALRVTLDDKAAELLSKPFLVAREVRGTDNSLIDIEYDVTNPEAFHAYLSRQHQENYSFDASLYYTEFARRIAKYLSENMVYTLTPTVPETEDTTSSVERFLFDTKEGYCVQYATSATLLLRAVGVPARYVEGYIAPKFSRNEAEDRVGNYICNVKDYNAHAWCEIYLENYGWLTTEVTTPYYSEMYDPYETVNYNRGDSSSSSITETPTVEEIEEVEEEDTFWDLYGDIVITVLITAAIAAAVIYVLYRFLKNREAMRYRHEQMLKKAKQHLAEEDERAPIASALYDNLRKTAAVFDVKPMTGETPREYTHRLDMRFKVKGENGSVGAAEAVYAYIAKNEFGDVLIDEEELWMLADYIVRLEDVIRAEAGFFMRFRLKYLLGLMD